MRIALDTNRYTDMVRGVPEAVQVIAQAEKVFLPVIVLGELRGGFAVGNRTAENELTLTAFLSRPNVEVLHADEQTSRVYGDLYRQVRKQGTPIPSNDLWIAALVLQHGATLYARDKHFDALPQLRKL